MNRLTASRRGWHWWALVILLAVAGARCTLLETLRDVFEVTPHSESTPRGPTAAASLLLDALAMFPMLMVLLSRWPRDRQSADRPAGWAWMPLLALGAWGVASSAWASDRFAAAISAFHFLAAGAMFFAAAHLIRSWAKLRVVGAFAVGLLLVMVCQGMIYRWVELPELQDNWRKNRSEILAQRNWEADSFQARQFEKRVLGQEVFGFTASPNSFGAVLVLLSLTAGGLLVQRIIEDREAGAWAFIALALAAGLPVLWWTHSRGAVGTWFLGWLLIGALGLSAQWRGRRPKTLWRLIVAVLIAGALLVVAHGVRHGTLFHNSLTFRWWYWVASAKIFALHPLLGVGWDNFSLHYLAWRLPQASEEIKDPHNFVARVAVEAGMVGVGLLVLWLGRWGWELLGAGKQENLPVQAEPIALSTLTQPLALIGWSAGGAMALAAIVGLDWSQSAAFLSLEMLKRLLFFLLLVLGAALAALGDVRSPSVATGPAPWLRRGLAAAVAMFLLHNLIDFSFFEVGLMSLFIMLGGALLGSSLPQTAARSRWRERVVAIGAAAAWLGFVGAMVVPNSLAEQASHEADELVRSGRPLAAASGYDMAFDRSLPHDSEQAFRAARALMWSNSDAKQVRMRLTQAIDANPLRVLYRATAAELDAAADRRNAAAGEFETALKLNPNDVAVRLRYAQLLSQWGRADESQQQYELALRRDDQLEVGDPKRLAPDRRQHILHLLETLKSDVRKVMP